MSYFDGDGVDKRADKGMLWMIDAARAGDARAMFSLYLRAGGEGGGGGCGGSQMVANGC